ncbi:sigma-70 family RNA polymerase sigma factor [Tessaracoccus sp.]
MLTPAPRPRTVLTAQARTDLIEQHLHVARFAVAEVAATIPSHVSREDLLSAAHVALVQAADRYDPNGGATFATYVLPRLHGAVIDELRTTDWASRSVRGKARLVNTATDALAATLGRIPTNTEVAAKMGTTTASVDNTQVDVHRAVMMSTSDPAVASRVPHTTESAEQVILQRERAGYLADAIASLPDKLREVVTRNFYDQDTLRDIAADLGVSESRVSQMRTQALTLIHTVMQTLVDANPVPVSGGVRAQRQMQQYAATVAARSTFSTRLNQRPELVDTYRPARVA